MSDDKTPEIPVEPFSVPPVAVSSETSALPSSTEPAPAPHAAGAAPVAWQWPSVHPESYKFAGVTGAIALVGFLAG